jgi:hypothetical protein
VVMDGSRPVTFHGRLRYTVTYKMTDFAAIQKYFSLNSSHTRSSLRLNVKFGFVRSAPLRYTYLLPVPVREG